MTFRFFKKSASCPIEWHPWDDDKDALPSDVCFLDLIDLCPYRTTGEHPSVTWDEATGRVLDSSCVRGGHALAVANHVLSVGWVRPMVMMNILRGIVLTTISRVVHDFRVGGGGRGGRGQSFGR